MVRLTNIRQTDSSASPAGSSNKESIASYGKKYSLSDLGFALHNQIAIGTYSQVYSATYTAVRTNEEETIAKKRDLAVKVIDAEKAANQFSKKFVHRELEILKRVHHPHIIHVQSLWKLQRKYFIFMRLAEFGDLCNFIANHGSVKEPLIKKWSRDLVVALMYLHTLDIAHRDIKCDNILLTNKYNVKLADFGFARYTRDHQGSPLFAATDCGSLKYTAPEVLLGIPYNPKIADIWSLGVVIFTMLNGTFPFVAKDVTSLYREQISRDFACTKKVEKYTSKHLLNVIEMLLEPVYHERMTLDDLLHSSWIGIPPVMKSLAKHIPIPVLSIKTSHVPMMVEEDDLSDFRLSISIKRCRFIE